MTILKNIRIWQVFDTLPLQEHPNCLWPIMSARPESKVKITSNLGPCKLNLKPDDLRKPRTYKDNIALLKLICFAREDSNMH